MENKNIEKRIKELLTIKIQEKDMSFLRGFYEIPGVYKYSLYNSLLIMLQGGSIALGFERWKSLGRHVKRGEHARIEILVPIIKKEKDTESDEINDKCIGFLSRKVFDVTQTDGKPLEYKNNSKDDNTFSYETLRDKLADKFKITIKEDITGNARGFFSRTAKEIYVSSMSNNVDKIKTLLHEVGHALLHGDDLLSADGLRRDCKEVEAELTSVLVCESIGVKCESSELYISNWNVNNPDVRIMSVISAVNKILKSIV